MRPLKAKILRPSDEVAMDECRRIARELSESGHRGKGGMGPTGSGTAYVFVEGEEMPVTIFGYSDDR
jgi:hypothetical protein